MLENQDVLLKKRTGFPVSKFDHDKWEWFCCCNLDDTRGFFFYHCQRNCLARFLLVLDEQVVVWKTIGLHELTVSGQRHLLSEWPYPMCYQIPFLELHAQSDQVKQKGQRKNWPRKMRRPRILWLVGGLTCCWLNIKELSLEITVVSGTSGQKHWATIRLGQRAQTDGNFVAQNINVQLVGNVQD